MLLRTSMGGPKRGPQRSPRPQGPPALLQRPQRGLRADAWLRTCSRPCHRGTRELARNTRAAAALPAPSPQPPLGPPRAALTMAPADRGRVPPAPFLHSSDRRPGRGAQLPAAVALARPLEAPLRSRPAPTTATNKTLATLRLPGRTEPAARAARRFYSPSQAPPPPGARSGRVRQRAR